MRTSNWALWILIAIGPWQAVAQADGGALRFMERQGPCQVSVFTAPTPLRPGPVDVSVLLQDVSTGLPIRDARITVSLSPLEHPATTIEATASVAAATNKMMQAAVVEIPASGRWNMSIHCEGELGLAQAIFEMEVGPQLPRWQSAWMWFSWPLLVILCFVTLGMRKRSSSGSLATSARLKRSS